MKTKLFEVRDEGTFLPVVAIQCEPANERETYLLARCGYGRQPSEFVLLARLNADTELRYDPERWGGRTMPAAHQYILDHWDELQTGDVVDVQYILGEAKTPKKSAQLTVPGWE